MVLFVVVTWVVLFSKYDESFVEILENRVIGEDSWANIARVGVFIVVVVAYVILHELIHGLVYKLLTKQKLKFGLALTVVYCGVPDIYVYRTAALLSLTAFGLFKPLTIFQK